ncbi:MAG: hypothetical protein GX256_01900 [Fretibacterium sp.]|nr:hypothetical protein [Fretibacterium sp.]
MWSSFRCGSSTPGFSAYDVLGGLEVIADIQGCLLYNRSGRVIDEAALATFVSSADGNSRLLV